MNTNILVDKHNKANVLIQNSEENHYSCYVEIYDASDSLLYKTETIDPGQKLEMVTLENFDHDITHGTAFFCLVNDNGHLINRISLKIQMTKE